MFPSLAVWLGAASQMLHATPDTQCSSATDMQTAISKVIMQSDTCRDTPTPLACSLERHRVPQAIQPTLPCQLVACTQATLQARSMHTALAVPAEVCRYTRGLLRCRRCERIMQISRVATSRADLGVIVTSQCDVNRIATTTAMAQQVYLVLRHTQLQQRWDRSLIRCESPAVRAEILGRSNET